MALTHDDQLVAALAKDYKTASLGEADRAMLDYAAKLTRAPGKMTERDVEALRQAGFGDAAILDVCQVTAYFNFVNRLADGLGVELETETEARTADRGVRRRAGPGQEGRSRRAGGARRRS